MDWPFVGLMLGLIGAVAGASWRFGRVEKAISSLEQTDGRLETDIRDIRLDIGKLREDVTRILERLPPPVA